MRIGDLEYTRHVHVITDTVQESEFTDVSFALGIKVRPLLTRIQTYITTAQAITGNQMAFLENGSSVGPTQTAGALILDQRVLPIHTIDHALATNGMGMSWPFETMWWKLLMPDVRIHLVATTLTVSEIIVIMHYRFAELSDDEVVEIAAQRAQG